MKSLFYRSLLLLTSIAVTSNIAQAIPKIHINEVMMRNTSAVLSLKYDYDNWIEFYNSGDMPANLYGHYLSDDANNKKKYMIIDNCIVAPKGYKVLWLNKKVKNNFYEYTGSPQRGALILSNQQGVLMDEVLLPPSYQNTSYGRLQDGGNEWGHFISHTMETSNNNAKTGALLPSNVEFSIKGGFYQAPVSVSLSTLDTEAEIFYTTDGSEPTQESTKYLGSPISINQTTPIRARAYLKETLQGIITTHTYFINERRPNFPIYSLVTDPKNLFDDMTGILVVGKNGLIAGGVNTPANYNQDWSRPTNMERFEEGKTTINQELNIEVSGIGSRHKPQKSLKLKPSKKFGNNFIEASIFPNKPNLRTKSIVLRNSGQDFGHTQIRDAFQHAIVANKIDIDYSDYAPSILYINGAYHGLINQRERSNDDYVYSNRGLSADSLEMVEYRWNLMTNVKTLDHYKQFLDYLFNNDVTDNESFSKIEEMIDIDSYINYMAIEIFVNNDDWPQNNQKMYRESNGGKWRWILQDLDYGYFQPKHAFTLLKNINTSTDEPSLTFQKLMTNARFKDRFIDQFAIFTGSLFRPERVNQIIDSLKRGIESEIPYLFTRFEQVNEVNKKCEEFKQFGTLRGPIMYDQLAEVFQLQQPTPLQISANVPEVKIRFNDWVIPSLPFNGKYFKGRTIVLSALPELWGKRFDAWKIVNDDKTEFVRQNTLEITLEKATSIEAIYESVPLKQSCGILINEVSPDNDQFVNTAQEREDWIELYNGEDKQVDLANMYLSDDRSNLTKYRIPEGNIQETTIEPYGHKLVWADNSPTLGPLHCNFKLEKAGEAVYLSKQNNEGAIFIVDSLRFGKIRRNQTIGRYPDGADQIYSFNTSTPCKPNLFALNNQFIAKQELVQDPLSSPTETQNKTRYYITDNNRILHVVTQQSEPQSYSLIHYSGRIIQKGTLTGTQTTLSIEHINKGVYILLLSDGSTFRFVR